MKRSSPPQRKRGVRKRNAKRRAVEWIRTYHSEERVLWVQSRPCALSGCLFAVRGSPSENVHAKGDGIARKAGYEFVLPLCHAHHRHLHEEGVRSFEKFHHVNLVKLAEHTHEAWLNHVARSGYREDSLE